MMYRNYNTGEIISEDEATDYIDKKSSLLIKKSDYIFEEWLDANYTKIQIFNFDRVDKEEIYESFLDFIWNKTKEAFLEDWEEIDNKEE